MKRLAVLAVSFCCGSLPQQAEAARRGATPSTLSDLASRKPPVVHDQPVAADPAQAVRGYEDFLLIPDTEPVMRAQALRRLGDLRLARAEELRAQHGPESPEAAAATREAIAAYRRLLEEQPGETSTEAVLYQLARAWESLGDTPEALAVLDRLVDAYPQGKHFDEAEFRRGEAFFSEHRYADADRQNQHDELGAIT